jgi:hypothetical protein
MHAISLFAYLDAGTGSLIIQAVIGVIAGIGVFWRRIVAGIKSKFSGSVTTEPAATSSDTKTGKAGAKTKK